MLYLRYTLISEAINMTKRIHALLKVLESNQLDSTLITSKENVYYLSHYYTDPHERVIVVYISRYHDPLLSVPAMEVNDAKASGWSFEILGYHDHEDVWKLLADFLKQNHSLPQSLGIEEDQLSVSRYQALEKVLPQTVLAPAQEMLAGLRLIKDEREFELLKQAAELADFGIKTGIHALQEGRSELEIIAEIEFALKNKVCSRCLFQQWFFQAPKQLHLTEVPVKRHWHHMNLFYLISASFLMGIVLILQDPLPFILYRKSRKRSIIPY